MKIAIMQPYVFPYIGYFQLINVVDTFVFYDDVNFIKGGWINRNKILINGKSHLFNIPLNNLSSFNLISDTEICQKSSSKNYAKILKSIEQSYRKAPYFNDIFPLLFNFFDDSKAVYISELAIDSIILISGYLNINTEFKISSKNFMKTTQFYKYERLIEISKKAKADTYINSIGGQKLYTKKQFAAANLTLQFLQSNCTEYLQFNNKFVPWLSIIDVLMFNSKEEIQRMLNQYELI